MISIYIHIPFCVSKCSYCDFFSVPVPQKGSIPYQRYCGAVLKQFSWDLRRFNLEDRGVSSIYFGGGTPSILPASFYQKIIWAIGTTLVLQGDLEVTAEVNPGTVNTKWYKDMIDAGVNRFSIGVQSFDDSMLKKLGRIHSSEEAQRAIAEAQDSGECSVSVDLMYGLPAQKLEDVESDLRIAMTFQPNHISAYQLTVERGTKLSESIEKGIKTYSLPDEDEVLKQLRLVRRMLSRGGWDPYEISNFARQNSVCRHNLHYWRYGEYLGLGCGATSFIEDKSAKESSYGTRWTMTHDIDSYLKGNMKLEMKDKISLRTAMGEFCFMGLRTGEGISTEKFYEKFGSRFDEVFPDIADDLAKKGLMEKKDDRIFLTESGVELSNQVFERFVE